MFFTKSEFLKEYRKSDGRVRDLFTHPVRPHWPDVSGGLEITSEQRAVLIELIRQNENPASKDTAQHLINLEKSNVRIVITGQQLGLFVSPLYTVFKALTAVKMAGELNSANDGFVYVPVFWLEGEDHDYAEINHADLPDQSGNLIRLELEENPVEANLSISRRSVPQQIAAVLDELDKLLQETDFKPGLMSHLRAIYKPGTNWLEAFKQQMNELLADTSILYFNPSAAQIKKISAGFFEQAVLKNFELNQAFQVQTEKVQKAGFENQVFVDANRSYIFLADEKGKREHLFRNDGSSFYLRDTSETINRNELLNLLAKEPARFSSSVLTRPLWQSWMLPVVSYVAGPAEIAYWAQLKSAFTLLQIAMPHLQSRASFTLIEPKTSRLMSKYSMLPEDLKPEENQFLASYFKENSLGNIEDQFKDLFNSFDLHKEKILSETENIDPTLKPPVEKTFEGAKNSIGKIMNKLVSRMKEKDELTTTQLRAIHQAFLPGGKLQERVLSSIYFSNKYGSGWIAKVLEQTDIADPGHKCIDL